MKKIKLRIKQIYCMLLYFIIYVFCKLFRIKSSDIWLIADRGNEAKDNGYFFYKYLCNKHPEIKKKFVISKKSKDISKINKNDILIRGSLKHYILFITSNVLISSHIMGYSPEFRIFSKLDKWNILKVKGKKIFLQHGITKDYSEGLKKGNIKLDLFVSGGQPEYTALLKMTNYDKSVIKYTGFARYDYLTKIDSNEILIMPTWRKNLFYIKNLKEFKKTNYFKMWNSILNSKELKSIAESTKMKIIFYPHYEIQPYIKSFSTNNPNIIIADSNKFDVSNLLRRCKILITDYSSVFFDVAYMSKPIIYYQKDYEDFRKNHYKEGYFKYSNDGFGKVVKEDKELFATIQNYANKKFKVEKIYQKRRNMFFLYNDTNNCKRIYKEIIKLI